MVRRIILTLALILMTLLVLTLFGGHAALGILVIFLMCLAVLFVSSGELIVAKLTTVKRMTLLQDSLGDYNLDPGKLVTLRVRWDSEKAKDVGASLEPTRIRNFCGLQLEKLVEIAGPIDSSERSRRISDVISIVSYPESRLSHIIYELRLYALLLAITFLFQIIKKAPDISTMLLSKNFLEGCRMLGERPIDFISGLELTIFAVFATRLLVEMSNLQQHIKSGGSK